MNNKSTLTKPLTTVRYVNLKASVYWDKKSYLTVYIGDDTKITNTIFIPISENFLTLIRGDKELFIDEIDNRVREYLKSRYLKNTAMERKRNILKNFTFFKVKNKIPFFLLRKNKNTSFL